LLDVLREQLDILSVKDGCGPQGQCGCCTVWVDGAPRVACVTPIRRLEGRQVTTLEGLSPADQQRWATALVATGGSQCGFCTPGIVMRLAALAGPPPTGPAGVAPSPDQIDRSLLAHLCRCTGWQTIEEAAALALGGWSDSEAGPLGGRDLERAGRRATLEGGVPQAVGPAVVLGRAGFADDLCPADALVAVPDGSGDYAVAETVGAARALARKVQGRRTSLALEHPIAVPPGQWDLTLQTTWVEPAYVEPDASWCVPGGEPASPVANGGAFGGKLHSPVAADARRLADRNGRPVRVLWSREDVVRLGPKRPPVAGGISSDGSGILRFGVPLDGLPADDRASLAARVAAVAPGLVLEPVPLHGPPIALDLRAAVWAEAAVLAAGARAVAVSGAVVGQPSRGVPVDVTAPDGGRAVVRCRSDDSIEVEVEAGEVLDEVVLRSYCIGATHQALGWVGTEGIAVDPAGVVHDLTVRSFGILAARDMPPVTVTTRPDADGPPVNASDAVFAAVAAARWLADGLAPQWPRRSTGGTP
jgi:xanthine dehydrogenase small subunit